MILNLFPKNNKNTGKNNNHLRPLPFAMILSKLKHHRKRIKRSMMMGCFSRRKIRQNKSL